VSEIRVRGIPDQELEALETRARRYGRSREAEVRLMIHDVAREELALQELSRATEALVEKMKVVQPDLPGEAPASHARSYRRTRRVEPTRHTPTHIRPAGASE
jgi:plasmid stability protein